MEVIGAGINTSNAKINEIVEGRNEKELLAAAQEIIGMGSHMLAINCVDRVNTEPEDIEWITRTIQKELKVPLCFDTLNLSAQEAGLKVHNSEWGKPLIDSTSLNEERIKNVLPLARKYNSMVIAILFDERTALRGPEDRLNLMPRMEEVVEEYGINREDIYLDSLVAPLVANQNGVKIYLESMSMIKHKYPGYKAICGINNISYGLPSPETLDNSFLSMCAALGQEAVFLEFSKASGTALIAIDTLQGKDKLCMKYVKAYRQGKL